MTENFFVKALFVSFALHASIVCVTYWGKAREVSLRHDSNNRIEISYKPARKKPVDIREHPIKIVQRLDLSNSRSFLTQDTIPVNLNQEKSALPFGLLYERASEGLRNVALSPKVSIVPMASEKINNPVYAAYKEMVHDRIQERVYANYDNLQKGFVCLTFLLDDRGRLKGARIIPEKTQASQHLQEIVLRSLQEASPFPAFLRGMTLTEYPFKVEIQFQVSDS